MRQICSPTHDLKIVQRRINRAIFSNVRYPSYLYGGIEARDYVKNAAAHRASQGLIALDIENFYPNISASLVRQIFLHFCKFAPPVADVLTALTTLNGVVPQGACTSSHLANLVFHDKEHRLVREFSQKGLTYTRLLDDITISTSKFMNKATVNYAIEKVCTLLRHRGFKLKSKKTKITSAGNPKNLMEVTGLWINRGAPRVKRTEREEIRQEVWRCEQNAALSLSAPDYHAEHNRVSGRVSKLAYIGHSEAAALRRRLERIHPVYDNLDVTKTLRLASAIYSTPRHDRDRAAYIERFHQVMYRLGILARTDPALAASERTRMMRFRPTRSMEEIIYG